MFVRPTPNDSARSAGYAGPSSSASRIRRRVGSASAVPTRSSASVATTISVTAEEYSAQAEFITS